MNPPTPTQKDYTITRIVLTLASNYVAYSETEQERNKTDLVAVNAIKEAFPNDFSAFTHYYDKYNEAKKDPDKLITEFYRQSEIGDVVDEMIEGGK